MRRERLRGICRPTWQGSDEVSLQHGHEDGVDVLVLMERHSRHQLLHKLCLPSLCPALKVSQTELTLVVKVFARGHGELTRVFVAVLTHHWHVDGHLVLEVLAGRAEGEIS